MTKTFMAREQDVERKWYIVDAKDKTLGRMATKIADVLRGKNKTIFTPHADTGDFVIVINAEKVRVTGKKLNDKEYQRFTGYPSGQKIVKLKDMLNNAPHKVIELAVGRMIPSGALGNKIKTKLRIFKGEEHPHAAQKPEILEF